MKVYAVIENFQQDCNRDEDNVMTRLCSVHKTREGAVEEIKRMRDETFDDIICGDENDLSRVSYDHEWDGETCELQNDSCCRWEWLIAEEDLLA